MINLEDEKYKIFSLFVWDSLSNTETEIFRNCRELVKNSMQYFGCGSLPFIVQYYGDLTNDGIPELLITADKEAGVLKLLIGKVNGSYKVIWSYDS